MLQPAYSLDEVRRSSVLGSIIERCEQRGWALIAAHVRTNHVHVIAAADASPERVMNDLKSYTSRVLNHAGLDALDRRRWARHGSTRWLRDRRGVEMAIRYVIEKQGDPMAVYVAANYR
jgi:REP element-mobilizing transposase RayT